MEGYVKLDIHIDKNYARGSTDIYLFGTRDHEKLIAKPIEFDFQKFNHNRIQEPTLRFEWDEGTNFLNSFADALKIAKFGDQKEYSLEAIKYHLEDMRRLVFNERNKRKS